MSKTTSVNINNLTVIINIGLFKRCHRDNETSWVVSHRANAMTARQQAQPHRLSSINSDACSVPARPCLAK